MMAAYDPAASYDEAVAIYTALLILAPIPSRYGYVRPALQNLMYALKTRGYTLDSSPRGKVHPGLIPWTPE